MSKSFKNLTIALVALFTITLLSSCGRGGYGCPYELKISTPVFSILK